MVGNDIVNREGVDCLDFRDVRSIQGGNYSFEKVQKNNRFFQRRVALGIEFPIATPNVLQRLIRIIKVTTQRDIPMFQVFSFKTQPYFIIRHDPMCFSNNRPPVIAGQTK